MAAAAADALRDRGVPAATAAVAAELGMLAFKEAFAAWLLDDNRAELPELARAALAQLQASLRELG